MDRMKWRRLSHGKQMADIIILLLKRTINWTMKLDHCSLTHFYMVVSHFHRNSIYEIRSAVLCVENMYTIIKNMVLGFKAVLFFHSQIEVNA